MISTNRSDLAVNITARELDEPSAKTQAENTNLVVKTSVAAKDGDGSQAIKTGGLRSAKAVARDRGISDVTLWRWQRRGWVKLVNIYGKNYVCLQSLAEFDRRAAAGEFARGPVGAAAASVKARMEKERLEGLE